MATGLPAATDDGTAHHPIIEEGTYTAMDLERVRAVAWLKGFRQGYDEGLADAKGEDGD